MSGRGAGAALLIKRKDSKKADNSKRRPNQFENFGEFQQVKLRKLADQLEDQKELNQIFAGISILVDGYTSPSALELRDLILARGGNYQYYPNGKVTHVISTHLPDAKIKDLRHEKIVHPNWIVDSCRQGVLQPLASYQLYQNLAPLQRTLDLQPTIPSRESLVSTSTAEEQCANLENHLDSVSFEPFQADELVHDDAVDEDEFDPEHNEVVEHLGWPSAKKIIQKEMEHMNDEWVQRNIATHPDFLERYFKSSRLHYLSTWKNDLTRMVGQLPKSLPPSVQPSRQVIMHIDMDCFFVSVGLRDRPHLVNQPVGVCHSKNSSDMSSGEVASCNYPARSFSIRNGMSLSRARQLCPELVLLPYEFDKYRQVSEMLYSILIQYSDHIQAVSCDEALIDVSSRMDKLGSGHELTFANEIRAQIKEATGCNASIGISYNILLARLATKRAKPNGQFYLESDQIPSFLDEIRVRDLPGVGWAIGAKLDHLKINNCKELRSWSLEQLQHELGIKIGETLYNFCRGVDHRALAIAQPRKTIGAEVNWGIRFEEIHQVQKFIHDLSCEVSRRLKEAKCKGRNILLKLKRRKIDFNAPRKFLGCGPCDNFSKSSTFQNATDDADVISREAWALYQSLQIGEIDLRGVGLHISRFDSDLMPQSKTQPMIDFSMSKRSETDNRTNNQQQSIDLNVFVALPKELQVEVAREYGMSLDQVTNAVHQHQKEMDQVKLPTLSQLMTAELPEEVRREVLKNCNTASTSSVDFAQLPSLSQIDHGVWRELPDVVQAELSEAYQQRQLLLYNLQRDEVELLKEQDAEPNLLGHNTIEGIRDVLKEWVQDVGEDGQPQKDDCNVVFDFVANHVRHDNLHLAYLIIRFLLRLVLGKPLWQSAIDVLVHSIQQVVIQHHHCPFQLKI